MRKTRPEGLDALLLRPMLELEQRLHERDHGHEHELADGAVHLLRHEHDISIDSDECEIIFATDGPRGTSPPEAFETRRR